MVRLYITRHGETLWNTQKKMQGHKNSELTDKGKQQAAQLGKALENVELEAVYSSSSGRTIQTSQIFVGQRSIPIIPMDTLMEMSLGKWEGMIFSDVEREYPVEFKNFWEFPHLYKPDGGENFTDVIARLGNVLKLLAERYDGKNVMVVTHAIALKLIMMIVEHKELKELWSGAFIHPTSLSIIEGSSNSWKAVKWGDVSHYDSIIDT